MKRILFMLLICLGYQVSAQRQKEITDFVEKWRIENVSMRSVSISGLPGAIEIIGNKTQTIDIKVVGEEVYLLQGGATGLGFMLSKDKNEHCRIQGIGDQTMEVTYQISLPDDAELSIDFGGQSNNSKPWKIQGMKGEIRLLRMKGDIEVDGAIGPVSVVNYNGDLKLNYEIFSQKEPHSISSLGDISIVFDPKDELKVELNAHAEIELEIGDEFEDPDVGPRLTKGRYEFSLNQGNNSLKLQAYKGRLILNTKE